VAAKSTDEIDAPEYHKLDIYHTIKRNVRIFTAEVRNVIAHIAAYP
jgi:hypothetical protein